MFQQKLAVQITPAPDALSPRYLPFGAYKQDNLWQWLDDVQVDFTLLAWQTSQPDGTEDSEENCLGFDLDKEMGVSDIPCGANYIYLCQMDPEEESMK